MWGWPSFRIFDVFRRRFQFFFFLIIISIWIGAKEHLIESLIRRWLNSDKNKNSSFIESSCKEFCHINGKVIKSREEMRSVKENVAWGPREKNRREKMVLRARNDVACWTQLTKREPTYTCTYATLPTDILAVRVIAFVKLEREKCSLLPYIP